MADTSDTGLLPRTYFRAPRVPFDFRALALCILGFLAWWGGSLLLEKIFDRDVSAAFLGAVADVFARIPFLGGPIRDFLDGVFQVNTAAGSAGSTFWHVFAGGVWFFGVWSFVGQGVHRITSLRIARDEGLSLVEALKFSWGNWVTVLLAPVIVMIAIGGFYLCNAFAGVLISVPFLGWLLALILVPLAVISSLLILLIGVGGVFGLPLIGAAAAWERNGSLDAISRAFSYVYARPLQYFWSYLLIFLFTGVIVMVGQWFVFVLVKSVDFGTWNQSLSSTIDPPKTEEDAKKLSAEEIEYVQDLVNDTGHRPTQAAAPEVTVFAQSIEAVGRAPWAVKVQVLVFWVFVNLIWLGVFGYALAWFIGAATSVYADLRADVDGTEEDEIYLEEEEQDFEALAQGGPTVPAPEPGSPASGGGAPGASGTA
jgi:hypothetical protein